MGYKNEKLWSILKTKAEEYDLKKPEDSKNQHVFLTGVESICEYAVNRAKAIRDTFPTYTLHDEVHICNVLRRMDDLLSSRISELTRDETAMLILSACCHDIGMSYNENDKLEALNNRERLDKYLEARPSEYVKAYEGNPNEPVMTEAILQNYFRSIHHERIQDLLNEKKWPEILNGCVDRADLITICQSHGEDISGLANLDATPTVDLRMCAVLLRLADILDFDTTRVPRSLYDYERIATTSNYVTQEEWEKHYSSNGFNFGAVKRDQPYLLPFSANCKSMQIEHIVQGFLNWIDSELNGCGKMLFRHTGRWQDLMLPEKIQRRIISEGYVSGEYHLTLDHDQVLDLLAGRDLYGDPSVFVRELLQNAIDSVRTRCELDKNVPRNWKPQINIRTWTDEEGYQWFRIEDNGIGMSEEIIRNYFLKIGCSYYNSSQFKKDKIRNNANPDYTPISRFGIGILSCFICGDQIEVSTKRFNDSKGIYPGYRLKMQGMNGYFYLADSSKSHRPGPMKGVSAEECRPYRQEAGTTIAVRTNLYKSGGYKGFKEIVSKYLLYPPVPVHYTGEDDTCDFISEQDFIDAVHNLPDSFDGRFEFGMSSEQMEQLSRAMPGFEWDEPPKAIVHCAAFDRYLPSNFLNGAIVSAWTTGHVKNEIFVTLGKRKMNLSNKVDLDLDVDRMELKLVFSYDVPYENQREIEYLRETIYNDRYYQDDFDQIELDIYDGICMQYHLDNKWKEFIRNKHDLSEGQLDTLLKEIKKKNKENISNSKKVDVLERLTTSHEFVVHKFTETSWLLNLFYMAINKCIIGHNGIVAETNKEILEGEEIGLGAIILLKDKYRPNIDVSRNNIKSLNATSAIALSLLKEQMIRHDIKINLDFSELADAQYRYILLSQWFDILKDMDDIINYLVVKTEKGYRSLDELNTDVQTEGLAFVSEIDISDYLYVPSYSNNKILRYITIALLRQNFKCMYLDDRRIRIESPNGNETYNIVDFPVMFFMDFLGDNQNKFASVFEFHRDTCNKNHAFSQWIIANQSVLRERVPGILFEINKCIMEDDSEKIILKIKGWLDIIKALPGNPISVPDNIYLSEADFY